MAGFGWADIANDIVSVDDDKAGINSLYDAILIRQINPPVFEFFFDKL